jgi:hypothetical protein
LGPFDVQVAKLDVRGREAMPLIDKYTGSVGKLDVDAVVDDSVDGPREHDLVRHEGQGTIESGFGGALEGVTGTSLLKAS